MYSYYVCMLYGVCVYDLLYGTRITRCEKQRGWQGGKQQLLYSKHLRLGRKPIPIVKDLLDVGGHGYELKEFVRPF